MEQYFRNQAAFDEATRKRTVAYFRVTVATDLVYCASLDNDNYKQ